MQTARRIFSLNRGITKDDYDKKLQELKDMQYRLDIEAEEHTRADHDYKLTIAQVFSLSRRMGEIFKSSEPHEKRAFLNYLLQNPTVSGKKLEFTLKKPWDTVLEFATTPNWLAWESAFRTYDWAKAFPDPEVATRQIRGLLALV